MSKLVIETFFNIDDYTLQRLLHTGPWAMNGEVHFRKHRITVEIVDEPVEVLAARLQKLWEENTNSHLIEPIKAAAAKLGIELQGPRGAKRRRAKKPSQGA